MTRLRALGAFALLFLQVARCGDILVPRDEELSPGEVEPISDIKYTPEEGAVPIVGRELVADWLNPNGISKRAYCEDPGYELCTATRCCPSFAQCCPGSPYCKRVASDHCCWSLGTCPSTHFCHTRCECVETGGTCCSNGRYCKAGYKCCSRGGCAPIGGQCCSNGQVCGTGNICVILSGRYRCCTDLSCTAYVDSGTTSYNIPTTTAPPQTTRQPEVIFRYYYYTITWYYYLYYFTYYKVQVSTLTSTYVTTTSVLSVYDNDAADATSSLLSLSSKASRAGFPTPASATTALALDTDQIGPGTTSTSTTPPSPARTDETVPNVNGGGGFLGPEIPGAADLGPNSVGAGTMQFSLPAGALVWGLVAGVAAVGAGMVLL